MLIDGLVIAVLADRVRYEDLAKSLIFLPQAISFVAAGTIWKFIYSHQPPGVEQTGTLNAITVFFGGEPQPWLTQAPTNNLLLIIVGVWAWVGFATVILSARSSPAPSRASYTPSTRMPRSAMSRRAGGASARRRSTHSL